MVNQHNLLLEVYDVCLSWRSSFWMSLLKYSQNYNLFHHIFAPSPNTPEHLVESRCAFRKSDHLASNTILVSL